MLVPITGGLSVRVFRFNCLSENAVVIPDVFFRFRAIRFVHPSQVNRVRGGDAISSRGSVTVPSLIRVIQARTQFIRSYQVVNPIDHVIQFMAIRTSVSRVAFISSIPMFVFPVGSSQPLVQSVIGLAFTNCLPDHRVLTRAHVHLKVKDLMPRLPYSIQRLGHQDISAAVYAFCFLCRVPIRRVLTFMGSGPNVASPREVGAKSGNRSRMVDILVLRRVKDPRDTLSLRKFQRIHDPSVVPIFAIILNYHSPSFATVCANRFLRIESVNATLHMRRPPFLPLHIPFRHQINETIVSEAARREDQHVLGIRQLILYGGTYPMRRSYRRVCCSFRTVRVEHIVRCVVCW